MAQVGNRAVGIAVIMVYRFVVFERYADLCMVCSLHLIMERASLMSRKPYCHYIPSPSSCIGGPEVYVLPILRVDSCKIFDIVNLGLSELSGST